MTKSLQDIGFAPLASNKEDERRAREKKSNLASPSVDGAEGGVIRAKKKSSNLRTTLGDEAADEKRLAVAPRARRVGSFMRTASGKRKKKGRLICFLPVH